MSKWFVFFRKLQGKRAVPYILSAAGLLSLILIGVGFFGSGGPKEDRLSGVKVIDDSVDLYMRDVHYTEVGESGNRLEINADSASFLKKENQARFERVRMKLIQPDGKIYELAADRGHLRTDRKDVEIEGNVVVVSSGGDRFTTERLRYSDSGKKIYTDDVVTLKNPRFEVTGTGMILWMKTNQITIARSVNARIP